MPTDLLDQVIENPGFALPGDNGSTPIIKVVGVGGGGNNAINHMYAQNVEGVSFVVLNTDRQALQMSPVPNRVLIGPTTTAGLGAGDQPEVALAAAEESADDIAALFEDNTKMVFITAGMGGGTGTGAAPVVARIAREKGILTIGIVTIPFLFEGQRKINKALQGAAEMRKHVDALLIINNQRLIDIYSDLDIDNAFGKADETLTNAARSISEMITAKGRINIDFRDVNTTLRDGGVAIISTGYGEGDNRVTKAIEDALNSPLLKDQDIYGSRRILVHVCYNPEAQKKVRAAELSEVDDFMANFSSEVETITGMTQDSSLGERVKITILAAGFSLSERKPTRPTPVATSGTSTAGGGSQATGVADSAPAPITTAADDMDNLRDIYGKDAIDAKRRLTAKAQYIIFGADDMDDDEIIELFESTPTLLRKQDVKRKVQERQAGRSSAPAAPSQPAAPPQGSAPRSDRSASSQRSASQTAFDFTND